MEVRFDGERVRAGRQAREQFYDARGYGRPDDGDLTLAPVEAAHLLFRGDLSAVVDDRPTGEGDPGARMDFRTFLASAAVSEVDFLVYKDLRDRGFYLSPVADRPEAFRVYPRGDGPWDGDVAYRVLAVSERAAVDAETLGALADVEGEGAAVLAVVDEESEVTYLECSRPTVTGASHHDLPANVEGTLLSDRVVVWDPPAELHERAFYGQRLDRESAPLQLSLVEAAYLAEAGHLSLDAGREALIERGRDVEGERFDRRLRTYSALRSAGVVPKTGFKFGADFRTYADVTSHEDLGHSELLVRVVPDDERFAPRDLALDVRLAHGVRKRMVYALAGPDAIDWLAIERLTP